MWLKERLDFLKYDFFFRHENRLRVEQQDSTHYTAIVPSPGAILEIPQAILEMPKGSRMRYRPKRND